MIVPDDKDWTWVLDRPCPECGLDTREVRPQDVAVMLREHAAAWPGILAAAEARRRPSPQVWSPLEYGCHVRDVFDLYDQRLDLMLTQDDPLYPNWDQDASALAQRYGEQDPSAVAGQLTAAAETLAAHFDEVGAEQWARPGRRSDGARFTIASFARYLVHDSAPRQADAASVA